MNHLLLTFMLAFAGPAPEQMEEAQILFRDGTVKYESADYNGAIENFTKALAIVTEQHGDDHTRLTLLYNIARAHEKAFTIDQDVTHLRQALALYERYLDFAQSTGNLGEELDVETKIAHLKKQLQIHSQIERNKGRVEGPQEIPPPPAVDTNVDWKKPRNTGIGLVAGGAAVTIGGVVLAVLGSQFEESAQTQVDSLADQGIPMDHPAWAEGEEFVASEKRRGAIFMGTGATVAVVGAAGIGVGTYYLVKSKRLREGRVAALPALSPGFAGVQISGRF
jgi:tetratricopeptide (TPR) repeat protein